MSIDTPRLRQIIAGATPLPWCGPDCHPVGHIECREIGFIGDIALHSPSAPFVRAGSESDSRLVVEAVNALPSLLDEIDRLRSNAERLIDPLREAAASLDTISLLSGRDEGMEDLVQVRCYAHSRATVAHNALRAVGIQGPSQVKP